MSSRDAQQLVELLEDRLDAQVTPRRSTGVETFEAWVGWEHRHEVLRLPITIHPTSRLDATVQHAGAAGTLALVRDRREADAAICEALVREQESHSQAEAKGDEYLSAWNKRLNASIQEILHSGPFASDMAPVSTEAETLLTLLGDRNALQRAPGLTWLSVIAELQSVPELVDVARKLTRGSTVTVTRPAGHGGRGR